MRQPDAARQLALLASGIEASSSMTIEKRSVRIPTIATTHSDGSRPPVPIDRDQCGAGADGAVG